MLSNSSKYAINAVIFLAVNASETKKIGVKDIGEALKIPSPFLAKILQILSRKKAISSTKGPGGGFWLNDEEKRAPLISIVYHIDGIDKFTNCALGLKLCSEQQPCPIHHAVQPFKHEFMKLLTENTICDFAKKVAKGEAFLFV
ncbi:RrF2 family transcriptional regulator [Capnocytophaga canimorsus]|uniref:RrF2 family transcriptional regulator n=1 Tax=Capnocytophaga canimorsus TaxID=28188 RepID=UPI000F6B6F15|nr:Rrf2 family transcriptional regulator [Capnocytophaga canimorsus]VEJ19129.1 HTH-type transcriptional regulator iscR [Capnocytophaga canimorsus]